MPLAVVLLLVATLALTVQRGVQRSSRKGRPNVPIWEEFTIVRDGKYKDVTCNHCGKFLHRVQPSRALIGHVLQCPSIPEFLRAQYKAAELNSTRSRKRSISTTEESSDEEGQTTIAIPRCSDENWHFRCKMAVAMFVFRTGVAFRIVEHPAFHEMFACVCPSMIFPDRHQLGDGLLTAAYKAEWNSVIAKIKEQNYVALVSDGWSNPRRESLINFIVVAPGIRPLLWCCRATREDTKTGAYIAEMIGEVIDEIEKEIGKGKVVSITTDNASSMQSAWSILETTRPGFMATGCATHALSLLMKDVLTSNTLKTILREAKEISLFIRSHTATNSRFSTVQSANPQGCQRGLKLPIVTRWYSSYECIKLVMENEIALRELFSDRELLSKYDSATVSILSELVASEVFWAKGAVALQLLEPIHKCLAHFESDRVCLSVIYQQFVELRSQPIYNNNEPGIRKPLQDFFRERIEYRWGFIRKDAMIISYLLDHTTSTSTFFGDDKIYTIQALVNLAAALGYGEAKQEQLQRELTQFMLDKLSWNDDVRSIYYKSSPPEWWRWAGPDKYPVLAPLAQMVFTIPTSSAAAERSWSIFKFIHSSRRNRLDNENVFKLAFIYSNQGAKDAIGPILYGTVGDFEVETSSLPSQPTSLNNVVGEDVLRNIQEMEQLVEGSSECDDDSAVSLLGGAHWGDEDHFQEEVPEEQQWSF